jgi:hypothetical protein
MRGSMRHSIVTCTGASDRQFVAAGLRVRRLQT